MTKLNCSCGKPKDDCLPFRKIVIPAVMGDDSEDSPSAPENGAYCNALVEYEANGAMYIYASDGIYTKISMVAGGAGAASITYVDSQDARVLSEAKAYTDAHSGGGGEDELFYITVTNADFDAGTFTADKTYDDILEAYNAGKLPVVIVKESDSSHSNDLVLPLSDYTVYSELDGFIFKRAEGSGSSNAVTVSGTYVAICASASENRCSHSYGTVEIDAALDQYSNHTISNSAVTTALQTKANTADLATVATSGSYADLTNKPTIPTFTLSTSDIGEGSPLAANNFYGVYE